MLSRRTVLAGCMLVGCSEGAKNDVRFAQQPIIGGELAIGVDEVVMVWRPGDVAGCSGTLIAARAVITAKHCVQLPDVSEPNEPSQLRVGVGRTLHSGAGLTWLTVESVHVVPGVYSAQASETLFGSDLAILLLNEPTMISPRAVRLSSPSELVGAHAQAIGYGLTLEGEA